MDEVEQLVAEYLAATACKSSPGVGTCIGQPWQRICVALALQLGIAAPRSRNWAKPERLYGEEWSCQRLTERYGCDDETVRQR